MYILVILYTHIIHIEYILLLLKVPLDLGDQLQLREHHLVHPITFPGVAWPFGSFNYRCTSAKPVEKSGNKTAKTPREIQQLRVGSCFG